MATFIPPPVAVYYRQRRVSGGRRFTRREGGPEGPPLRVQSASMCPGASVMRKCLLAVVALLGASTPAAADSPTFYKDVLPILQKNCQTCHRPGEVAPMSLVTFEDTRPWARAIKTAVAARKMPPWFADPAVGHFAN